MSEDIEEIIDYFFDKLEEMIDKRINTVLERFGFSL